MAKKKYKQHDNYLAEKPQEPAQFVAKKISWAKQCTAWLKKYGVSIGLGLIIGLVVGMAVSVLALLVWGLVAHLLPLVIPLSAVIMTAYLATTLPSLPIGAMLGGIIAPLVQYCAEKKRQAGFMLLRGVINNDVAVKQKNENTIEIENDLPVREKAFNASRVSLPEYAEGMHGMFAPQREENIEHDLEQDFRVLFQS